jgi:hypothetical protein
MKQKKLNSSKLTFSPIISNEEAKQNFIKSLSKQNNNSTKDNLEKFLMVADHITSNMRSFSIDDFIYSSRPFEIPPTIVKDLFERYVEVLVQCGKLDAVQGCYDNMIYISQ